MQWYVLVAAGWIFVPKATMAFSCVAGFFWLVGDLPWNSVL